MRTADLTGPLLDYWTARAEGIPTADLELRGVQRTDNHVCVRHMRYDGVVGTQALEVLDYSTNWALAGPLLEKHGVDVYWLAKQWNGDFRRAPMYGQGGTPLLAICRAVVRAAFGDDVEDLPCA